MKFDILRTAYHAKNILILHSTFIWVHSDNFFDDNPMTPSGKNGNNKKSSGKS